MPFHRKLKHRSTLEEVECSAGAQLAHRMCYN